MCDKNGCSAEDTSLIDLCMSSSVSVSMLAVASSKISTEGLNATALASDKAVAVRRKRCTSLAYFRVNAIGKRPDKRRRTGRFNCIHYIAVSQLPVIQPYVICNIAGKKEHILQYNSNILPNPQACIFDVYSVN